MSRADDFLSDLSELLSKHKCGLEIEAEDECRPRIVVTDGFYFDRYEIKVNLPEYKK